MDNSVTVSKCTVRLNFLPFPFSEFIFCNRSIIILTRLSTDVLTTKEVDSIYQHYSHQKLSDLPGLFPLKFPTQQRYKYEDKIEIEIEKLSEFALKKVGSYRLSDAVDIGGFSWKILAKNNEKWLGFLLYNDCHKNADCKSSATLRIVSQKNGTEDLIGRFKDRIFDKERNNWGFNYFISFAELLDPSKGFYNKDEDKVTLAIDVIMDEPTMKKCVSDSDKSNGTISMEIENLSEFVREVIFSERNSELMYIKGI
ncbi:hypothetical protein niasHS_004316 [Heterodera schachtii]|uniref:MATH domain-containing protein n=1 Tax=Heterodera schachtii TaxID=97005 RepID=A0ABD2JUT2_HETSC